MTRAVCLVISDIHIGNATSASRTGASDYGRVQERRRLAEVVRQAQNYKLDHRRGTELHLFLLGDLIRGDIHGPGEVGISEQVCRAAELLSDAVHALREAYSAVRVYGVSGNHDDMLVRRHGGRIVEDKADSYASIVYAQLPRISGVSYNIPRTAYVEADVLGKRILATHSDVLFRLPNPGRALNVAKIEHAVNAWSISRGRPDMVLAGHWHQATVQLLPCGTVFLINGCLCPVDEYTMSVGIPNTSSAQMMFEVTRNHAPGDMRMIRLTDAVDRDRSLDKVL